MSNTIANQTWQMIEATNASLQQSQTDQNQGQAQVAQGNRSSGSSQLLQLAQDVVQTASGTGVGTTPTSSSTTQGLDGKPGLPFPPINSKIFQGAATQQMGMLAIIGAVLSLQAKTNSNFWSTVWQQASQSMMIQVQFAPVIATAITSQYNQQATATLSQSKQSLTDGIISLVAFGLSMATAGALEYNDANPTQKATQFEDESKSPEPSTSAADGDVEMQNLADQNTDGVIQNENTDAQQNAQEGSNAERANANKTAEDITNKANGNESSSDQIKSQVANGKSTFQKVMATGASFMTRGVQVTQMFSMISQGATGIADSVYYKQQAAAQALEGDAAAVSQEAQMYSQFYGQDFTRDEDLRQSTSQNLDYAMNILQQAANSITQTVTSMFRG